MSSYLFYSYFVTMYNGINAAEEPLLFLFLFLILFIFYYLLLSFHLFHIFFSSFSHLFFYILLFYFSTMKAHDFGGGVLAIRILVWLSVLCSWSQQNCDLFLDNS